MFAKRAHNARTTNSLVENWTSRVPSPDRAGFRPRLEQDLRNEAGGQILTPGIENCVREALRPFRESAAASEVKATWPGVVNLSMGLDEDAIEQLSRALSPEQAYQAHVLENVRFHMEEAQNLFETNRRALLDEGRKAVQTQRFLVEAPDLKSKYQNEARQSRGTEQSKRRVQRDYEEAVLERWNQQRTEVLARVDGQIPNQNKYGNLFKVTREEIRDLLKDDAVQALPIVASGDQPTGGGGGGLQGGTGNGVGPGAGNAGGGGGGNCGAPGSKTQPQISQPQAEARNTSLLSEVLIGALFSLGATFIGYRWGRKNGVRAGASHG